MKLLSIEPATNGFKKYVARFIVNDKPRNVYFGAVGYGDFIQYSKQGKDIAQEKRKAYIARHGANEDWTDPTKPGTLSRYILWEYPTFQRALKEYKRKFNL
jgi:hypothetical protein